MCLMARERQRPAAPGRSELQVSMTEAQEFLQGQLDVGRTLVARQVRTEPQFEELEREASRWRDMNGSWLDINLGGDAAREYRDTAHPPVFIGGRLPWSKEYEFFVGHVGSELTKIQSIYDRLALWAPRPVSSPAARSIRTTGDVFVVHGSNEDKANTVARQIDLNTDRKAVILHEQPNGGNTLIEKLETHGEQAAYAVVILTADDEGAKKGEDLQSRARQNVVFEMGFFFGLIGRGRVCVLYEPGVEQPSDIRGLVYVEWDPAGGWKAKLLNEMRAVGIGK